MSHDRIVPKIDQLEREVADLLAQAEAVDREEDDEFGEDHRGDEIPAELARRRPAWPSCVRPRRPSSKRPGTRRRKRLSKRQSGARGGGPSRRGKGGRGGDPRRAGPAQLHRS